MSRPQLDKDLSARLLAWYDTNARDLPWRHSADPYRVWVSEIMLQQTRVDTVIPYYTRFLAAVPTIAALAEAGEQTLLKLWEGLGYYTRVRNLQRAAQQILLRHGGVFPRDVEDIRALPGIGEYTAGAIASICYGDRTPAVDGNVVRVIARISAWHPPAGTDPKAAIANALAAIYPETRAGDFTQALMELGATVCLPNGPPLCADCPMAGECRAHRTGTETAYPPPKEKKARRIEERTVWILEADGKTAIRRRTERGVLSGMWELPNRIGIFDDAEILSQAQIWGAEPDAITARSEKKHIFTHIEWRLHCVTVRCRICPGEMVWATAEELARDYALPTAFRKCLEDKESEEQP